MSSAQSIHPDNELRDQREYWLQKFSGGLVTSGIPLDYRRPVFSEEKTSVAINFDGDVTRRLFQFRKHSDARLFALLMLGLKICVFKYTGCEDIVVGTLGYKQDGESDSQPGVLALRDHLAGALTTEQAFHEVMRTFTEATSNQGYSVHEILDLLSYKSPANQTPLINTMLVLEPMQNAGNLKGLEYDLALIFKAEDDCLNGIIEYNPALFKAKTIEVFRGHYTQILRAMLESPTEMIDDVELLTAERKHELVFEVNRTHRSYPTDKTIIQLFEQQVAETPDEVALEFEDQRITYRELNNRADQLARRLIVMGLQRGQRVAICCEHSPEMIVGILSILKAAGAFVPLDPEHPKGRLSFILNDAQVSIILTQERLRDRLETDSAQVVCLDSEGPEMSEGPEAQSNNQAQPEDIVYLIYTSGSTGEPKGVKIRHSALVNYICWAKEIYSAEGSLNFPLFTSLAFDLTMTSIFTPLLSGHRIIIYPRDENGSALFNILKENRVDILKLTPSHLSLIKEADHRGSRITRLIVGGEALESQLAKRIYESFGGVQIINEYGPTETTVGCMAYSFEPVRDSRAFVPIGRPGANMQVYVLDESLKPVAENVMGELYISGAGVAEGYLNRDQLTAEKFIADPFVPGNVMYRSGDLARWLPEGEIEYAGRRDNQIKFLGYRVELSEISSVLNRHPQVRDSVVVAAKDQNDADVIVAYYVSRQVIEISELREFLAGSIIKEVIPHVFIHLKKLPLTLNGKLNLEALPKLEEVSTRQTRNYLAPRTPVQEMLAEIWEEIFSVKQVSISDDFFELGGHSMTAAQLISQVQQAFQINVTLRQLFNAPTVAELALAIEEMIAARTVMETPALVAKR